MKYAVETVSKLTGNIKVLKIKKRINAILFANYLASRRLYLVRIILV